MKHIIIDGRLHATANQIACAVIDAHKKAMVSQKITSYDDSKPVY